jgi:ribosomal protein S18 acetylase RimI-like enzyme
MVQLRPVGPDDWRLWRALRLAALAEAPEAFSSRLEDWQGPGDREERWRARLSTPGHHVVAVEGDREIGMASGVLTDQHGAVELISMWVEPSARGLGVGSALLSDVRRWAESVGARVLQLDVTDGNTAALKLYERYGFRSDGSPARRMPDGVRMERTMVLPLR